MLASEDVDRLALGQGELLASSRNPVSTRRPELSGLDELRTRSIFGSTSLRRSERPGIADTQGGSFVDAGTTRGETTASCQEANQYFSGVRCEQGAIIPATKDSDVFSFLAGPQHGRSQEDHTVSLAGTSSAPGLGAQAPSALGCESQPLGASGVLWDPLG